MFKTKLISVSAIAILLTSSIMMPLADVSTNLTASAAVVGVNKTRSVNKASKTTNSNKLKVTAKSNNNKIQLKWTSYQGANSYKVSCWRAGKKRTPDYSIKGTNCTFKNLKKGAKYVFVVTPVKNGKRVTSYKSKLTKSTQKYKLLRIKSGSKIYASAKCTTPVNYSSKPILMTGVYDEFNGCYKIQLTYHNYYVEKNNIKVVSDISNGKGKVLPTGTISQLNDGKSQKSYSCGCGPTSVTMLIDWELKKGKTRDHVIKLAAKKRVAILGTTYTFSYDYGRSQGLRKKGMTQLLNASVKGSRKVKCVKARDNKYKFAKQLRGIINSGHRAIIGISPYGGWGHYVVVTGYYVKNNKTHFIIADPLYSKNILEATEYDKNNNNICGVVDYNATELYNVVNKARNCSYYRRFNSSDLGYVWYLTK